MQRHNHCLISLLLMVLGVACQKAPPLPAGQKKVQCIANYPVDAQYYTRILEARGYPVDVEVIDIKRYEKQLLKKQDWFHKCLRKWHLDFPRKIALPPEVEKILFFNLPSKLAKMYDLSLFPKEKLVLFLWEPKTVLHYMYTPQAHAYFSKVYTWDDDLLKASQCRPFCYPVLTPMSTDLLSFHDRKLCTLIASDLKSAYSGELYSERERAVAFFEMVKEEGFELWGRGWNQEQHPSYCGSTPDKLKTLEQYKFCICYENTSNAPGYITEKIFDCFAVGTVPIYLGAPNILDYIPAGCFIDSRAFDTFDALYQFIKHMSEEEYLSYKHQMQSFLNSPAAYRFSRAHWEEVFCEAVVELTDDL